MTIRTAGFVECAAGCGTLVRPGVLFGMCLSCGSDAARLKAKWRFDAARARMLGPHSEIERVDVGVGEYLPDGPGLRDVPCLMREATWRERIEVIATVLGVWVVWVAIGSAFGLGCVGLWHALFR